MDQILIIDDDPRNVFALKAVLRSKGFATITAQGAIEGIEIVNQDNTVSVVLMDMMMPDIDGYHAIRMIREGSDRADIPIIAVTAQAMPGDKERCLEAGANAYLSKPIDVDLLVQLLATHIRKK